MGDPTAPFIAIAAAGLLWAGIAIAMLAFAFVQTRKYLRRGDALLAQAEQEGSDGV